MTIEEAREVLQQIRKQKCVSECDYSCKLYESEIFCLEEKALDMAIKALEQQPCEDCISILNRIMEYTYGMLTTEKFGLQHLIKSMMDDLPSVTPQQARWIPVSERLPEENIHVLCQFYMGGMAECYHAHDYWHIVGGFRIKIDDVLAWMPLPEPYEEIKNA